MENYSFNSPQVNSLQNNKSPENEVWDEMAKRLIRTRANKQRYNKSEAGLARNRRYYWRNRERLLQNKKDKYDLNKNFKK